MALLMSDWYCLSYLNVVCVTLVLLITHWFLSTLPQCCLCHNSGVLFSNDVVCVKRFCQCRKYLNDIIGILMILSVTPLSSITTRLSVQNLCCVCVCVTMMMTVSQPRMLYTTCVYVATKLAKLCNKDVTLTRHNHAVCIIISELRWKKVQNTEIISSEVLKSILTTYLRTSPRCFFF